LITVSNGFCWGPTGAAVAVASSNAAGNKDLRECILVTEWVCQNGLQRERGSDTY